MAKVNFKFGEFCRLCLKQAEDLIYLKSVDSDFISFIDKLSYLNKDLTPPNDVFPYWICHKCKRQLCFAYKFAKRCLTSMTVLNECLNQIQQNHFGDDGKLFYITKIKNVQKNIPTGEDPLTIKEEELENIEENFEETVEEISIPIKKEPQEVTIDTHEEITIDTHEEISIDNPQELVIDKTEEMNFTTVKVEPSYEEEMEAPHNELLVPSNNIRVEKSRKRSHKNKNSPPVVTEALEKCIFTCSICFRHYRSEVLLANHILIHKNMYSCALCAKSFRAKDLLARHLESHLVDEEKYYECNVCSKRFTNVQKLRRHYSEHNQVDKNGKKICATKQVLESYKNRNRIEILECNICREKFDQRRALIVHMRSHF